MKPLFRIALFYFCLGAISCSESETPATDIGRDYQPMETGLFWEYKVVETVVFGESDSETSNFFLRDKIDYVYINAEGNEVFVVTRQKSENRENWSILGNYALQYRNQSFIRTFNNQSVVNLVFPPNLGQQWDAQIYTTNGEDLFTIDFLGDYVLEDVKFSRSLRVLQDESDDEITFRDNRYEVYSKGIGMIEQYYEVYSYCSRNDCLGQQILDSGRLTHLKILTYGKE